MLLCSKVFDPPPLKIASKTILTLIIAYFFAMHFSTHLEVMGLKNNREKGKILHFADFVLKNSLILLMSYKETLKYR